MSERKAVIVTGAGSGIGREACLLLAAAGYDLALVGRRRDALQSTAREARDQASGRVDTELIPTDLCDAQATRAVAGATHKRFGRIDAVANIAGAAPMMPIEKMTAEDCQLCIDTNLTGVVNLTAAVWPIMREQGGGVIVNVSSVASVDPFPGFAVYAATKAALNMFTRCCADEGQDAGIKAVAVAPGAVDTPMLRALFDEKAMPPEKTLSAADVARAVVDCLTGKRAFEPGEAIMMPSP